MADSKISALTALTKATVDVADVIPIVDTSATTTKNITYQDLIQPQDDKFRIAGSSDNTKLLAFEVDGFTTATTRTITVPDTSDTMVTLAATQTLTNKTLTSPVVNVGSDATGDIYYRNAGGLYTRLPIGSNTQILQSNGTTPAWVANPSASNSSSTVAGIVELATTAEINAGTATGGTGAALVVTPDQLTASNYLKNNGDGSSLTGISTGFLTSSTADVTFNNSSAENTLFTYALAGGTLSTNKGVRVRVVTDFSIVTSNINCTFRIKYGGTTLATWGQSGTSGTPSSTGIWVVDVLIQGAGTTGTQEANIMWTQTGTTFSAIAGAVNGSSSIDSTTSQNIVVTAQMDVASVNSTSALRSYLIQKVV